MTKTQPIPDTAIDQYGKGIFFLCLVFCPIDLFRGESADAATDEDAEAEELWCVGDVSNRGAIEECVGLNCGVCVVDDEDMYDGDISGEILVVDKVVVDT